jgi:hypothetical protein
VIIHFYDKKIMADVAKCKTDFGFTNLHAGNCLRNIPNQVDRRISLVLLSVNNISGAIIEKNGCKVLSVTIS